MVQNFVLETTGCCMDCSVNKSDLQMELHLYQELQVPSSAAVKGCSFRPVRTEVLQSWLLMTFKKARIQVLFPSYSFYTFSLPWVLFYAWHKPVFPGFWRCKRCERRNLSRPHQVNQVQFFMPTTQDDLATECVLGENLSNGTNWVSQESKFTAREGAFGLSRCFSSVTA